MKTNTKNHNPKSISPRIYSIKNELNGDTRRPLYTLGPIAIFADGDDYTYETIQTDDKTFSTDCDCRDILGRTMHKYAANTQTGWTHYWSSPAPEKKIPDPLPSIEELINGSFKDYSAIEVRYNFEDDTYLFTWVGDSFVCVISRELLDHYEWGEFKDNKLFIIGGFILRAQAPRDNGDVIFFRELED
jgi:hypothetical protein